MYPGSEGLKFYLRCLQEEHIGSYREKDFRILPFESVCFDITFFFKSTEKIRIILGYSPSEWKKSRYESDLHVFFMIPGSSSLHHSSKHNSLLQKTLVRLKYLSCNGVRVCKYFRNNHHILKMVQVLLPCRIIQTRSY